jgi:hypothetical protein
VSLSLQLAFLLVSPTPCFKKVVLGEPQREVTWSSGMERLVTHFVLVGCWRGPATVLCLVATNFSLFCEGAGGGELDCHSLLPLVSVLGEAAGCSFLLVVLKRCELIWNMH